MKINFEDKFFWCNEHGQFILQNKTNRKLFAQRAYYWIDRVIIIDETNGGRRIIDDKKQSDFCSEDWEIILPEEEKLIKKNYSEIEQIRRDRKLNHLLENDNRR